MVYCYSNNNIFIRRFLTNEKVEKQYCVRFKWYYLRYVHFSWIQFYWIYFIGIIDITVKLQEYTAMF